MSTPWEDQPPMRDLVCPECGRGDWGLKHPSHWNNCSRPPKVSTVAPPPRSTGWDRDKWCADCGWVGGLFHYRSCPQWHTSRADAEVTSG